MFNGREESQGEAILIKDFCKECGLTLLCGEETDEISFTTGNVNRPGLLFAGFEDYFGGSRVQVIGYAEHFYLEKLSRDERAAKMEILCSMRIPCIIYSRGITPAKELLAIAVRHNIPVFKTDMITSQLINELVSYFNKLLAPTMSMHGVLVEVSGIGVLLTGHTGMGKSETALELIHRGHRLVSDDAVILKKIQNEIFGFPPARIEHFMEIRGIGIIDVRSMFGVGSVLKEKKVDLVIEFEEWDNSKQYDRLEMQGYKENIFGVEIAKLRVPVMPGRNLAIVVEVAARNERLKAMGYNALDELIERSSMKKR